MSSSTVHRRGKKEKDIKPVVVSEDEDDVETTTDSPVAAEPVVHQRRQHRTSSSSQQSQGSSLLLPLIILLLAGQAWLSVTVFNLSQRPVAQPTTTTSSVSLSTLQAELAILEDRLSRTLLRMYDEKKNVDKAAIDSLRTDLGEEFDKVHMHMTEEFNNLVSTNPSSNNNNNNNNNNNAAEAQSNTDHSSNNNNDGSSDSQDGEKRYPKYRLDGKNQPVQYSTLSPQETDELVRLRGDIWDRVHLVYDPALMDLGVRRNLTLTKLDNTGMQFTPQEVEKYRSFRGQGNHTRKLLEWMAAPPAGQVHKIWVKEMEWGSDSRTLYASEDIEDGEPVFIVPVDKVLTINKPRDEQFFDHPMYQTDIPDYENVWLSIWLLMSRHKGNDTRWKYFLDTMPLDYSFMPCTKSATEMLELAGSMTVDTAQSEQQDVRNEWTYLKELVPALESFTLADWVWARLMVSTRVFGLAGTDAEFPQKSMSVMVPLADLINHEDSDEKQSAIWDFNVEKRQFEMSAVRDIKAGEEIFTTYGARTNSELYNHYGFALEENRYNEASICIFLPYGVEDFKQKLYSLGYAYEMEATDSLYCAPQPSPAAITPDPSLLNEKEKERFNTAMTNYQNYTNSSTVYRCILTLELDSKMVHKCFSFLRLALSTREKKAKYLLFEEIEIDYSQLYSAAPLSLNNEYEVVLTLASACRAILLGLRGGTAAQDLHYAKTHKFNDYSSLAMIYARMGEKLVLEHYAKLGELVQEFLELLPKTSEEAWKFLYKTGAHHEYFHDIFLPLYYEHMYWNLPADHPLSKNKNTSGGDDNSNNEDSSNEEEVVSGDNGGMAAQMFASDE